MDPVAALDPNNVKVLTDNSGRALYFSRYPLPYDRDGQAGFNTTSTWAFTLTRGRRCPCFTLYRNPRWN